MPLLTGGTPYGPLTVPRRADPARGRCGIAPVARATRDKAEKCLTQQEEGERTQAFDVRRHVKFSIAWKRLLPLMLSCAN